MLMQVMTAVHRTTRTSVLKTSTSIYQSSVKGATH